MIIPLLLLILGFVLLIKGADWLVKGAAAVARKKKVSDLAVGLTVVAFGTSAPELVVNTFAAYDKHYDLVLGNIIGSNIFNLFAILGLTGIITSIKVQASTARKEIPFSFLALLVLFIMTNDFFSDSQKVSRFDGILLLLMFVYFLYYVFKQLGKNVIVDTIEEKHLPDYRTALLIIVGLTGLIIGGRLVVINAEKLALAWGMSEKVIGLTIVAMGTSLPELATSVIAAYRKNNDIAVGNIIGSNIFNIFLILGASAIIEPVIFNSRFNMDMYVLAAGTILLFAMMFTGKKNLLDRWEALILFLLFVSYTTYLITMGS